MSHPSIKTPCIGLCSTVYGDLVCRGCKRFHHEIVAWNAYEHAEKQAVWLRLEQLLAQVVAAKLEVVDENLLREQLERRGIHYLREQSPYCWAYRLIMKGARFMQQLDAYGLARRAAFQEMSLVALRDAIDAELFVLSEAHYSRYIAPGFLTAWQGHGDDRINPD